MKVEIISKSLILIRNSKAGHPFIRGLEGRLNTMMNKFKCKPDNWNIIRLSTNLQGSNLWGTNNE